MAERLTHAQLAELKGRHPCDQVAAQWVTLRRHGQKMIGPCPIHSSNPHAPDSTSFECSAEHWVCAVCNNGGDVIKLVALRESLDPKKDFRKIVEILGGARQVAPAEAARLEVERERVRKQCALEAAKFRNTELRRLFDWWDNAIEIAGTDAERYLELRRCPAPLATPSLRFRANHELYDEKNVAHRGPAMLAAIVNAEGKFCALHATWLDLRQRKGKAIVKHPARDDEILPAKKVRGSKAGGHIELVPRPDARRLVIGEGIETVLSVYNAMAGAGRDLTETAFWSSVDLGNLAGKAAGTVPHPTQKAANNRTSRVPGPVPYLDAPGLIIPDTVDDILLLGDGDSDRFLTECALVRAATRFARPGRSVRVAWARAGLDFNDMLLESGPSSILAALDTATVPVAPIAAGAAPKKEARPSHMGGDADKDPPQGEGGPADPPNGGDLNLRLAFYTQTDLGNAERFRERMRGKLLWCEALGWLWWDGRRWSREAAKDRVRRAEHEVIRAIQDEAKAIKHAKRDRRMDIDRDGKPIWLSEQLKKWGRKSEMRAKLRIAEDALPYLAVDPAKLDADPFMVNVLNGTLVIARREAADYVKLKPHDPADLITKLAPVTYDPTATCQRFDQFLAEIQKDPETRAFLMRWQGYGLTGDTSEQKLAVFWGKGRNGKSVLVDTCAYIRGDYDETVPIETFLSDGRGRSAGQATPDLAILPGKRSLRTSEPRKGARLDEALIKLATGGEEIQARHLNRGYFKFYPVFKLTISGNYRPKIGGTDDGIWGRVCLVRFNEFFPPEKRDLQLAHKLRAEASGILNRMLDGLREWFDRGLSPPPEVADATEEYRRDTDQLGRFLETCVVRTDPAEKSKVQSSVLLATFNAWARAGGGGEWKTRGFSDAMIERGFKKDKISSMFWLDIKLIKTVDDFVDYNGEPLRAAPSSSEQTGGDDDEVH